MGTKYERWLVAKGKMFAPGSEAVAKLVAKLIKDQWIAPESRGHAVKTVAAGEDGKEELPGEITAAWLDASDREEVRLVWPGVPAMKYPLSIAPDGERSFALEIHRCAEYVYPTSKHVGALPTECACGEDLEFEWDEDELAPAFARASGIFAECEECSRTFDPFKGTATLTNPFDGSTEERAGGGAYLFGLKIACESFARDPRLAFAKELAALVEEHFGRAFCEYGTER
ncbi:MAG: hypothetical protein KF819_21510 [Labilithrix sp.]|nr:hypothetical protein [Labilithrix sp.]